MHGGRLKRGINRHKLPVAIFIVICIALVMTAISMSLYITSGTSSLDLSRPGYRQVRQQVVDTEPNESFNDSGPLTKAILDDFKKLFTAQKKTISGIDAYADASLSDESLRLQ
ncbi:MAG TPA: hypothetical protein VNI82_00510 [Candidatus Nitrosotenuis sp.]|nr:hypothetical protein [Candidatus Nitrosotenuis sp.]